MHDDTCESIEKNAALTLVIARHLIERRTMKNWLSKLWIRLRPFKGYVVLYRNRHKWWYYPYNEDRSFRASILALKEPYIKECITSRGFIWRKGEGWSQEILTKSEIARRISRAPGRFV